MEATVSIKRQKVKRVSSLQKAWYRFTRRKAAVAGLAFIIFELVFTLSSPLLVKLGVIYDPYYNNYAVSYQPPSMQHPFGTDEFGRDMVSRIIYGAQVSYAVGLGANISGMLIGLLIGSIAGLSGGWLDYMIMRVIDVLSSVPSLLLYILLMIALGGSLINIIVAMSITGWIGVARLVRGQVLSSDNGKTGIMRQDFYSGGKDHIVFYR